jgi:hypothetical protein
VRIIIVLVLFILSLIPVIATGQDTIQQGRIIGLPTYQGADNIRIINLRTGRGAITDMHGYFRISCHRNDSILISSVQYEMKTFRAVPSVDTLIYLEPAVYVLPTAKVLFNFKTYNEFKDAVLALPKESYEKDEIPWFKEYFAKSKEGYISTPSFSPITYLYNKYSKHALEMKRYNYILEQERVDALISSRYNPQIVSNITGLTSADDIKKFMDFCHIPDSYVISASEYELYQVIMNRFRKYQGSH